MSVKSADRALEVLELLTSRERALTFSEIGETLGIPVSSLHGLLQNLTARGWVQYSEVTRRYALGLRTLEAGNAYVRSFPLPERALPVMAALRDKFDETVQLAVLDGRHNVYVAKVDGSQALMLDSQIGRRIPAHATGLGKALLAGLSSRQVNDLLRDVKLERFTGRTITDLPTLQRHLAGVRRHGYAFDIEEYSIGVQCVAAPVRNSEGQTVAGMSLSVPTARLDVLRRQSALQGILAATVQLSVLLGFRHADA